MGRNRGFTLIELLATMMVIAVLGGVAMSRYFDWSDQAREADESSMAGIRTALQLAYMDHRVRRAPAGEWITSINDIASVMQTRQLPHGITITGGQLEDQRGNKFDLTAETATDPAILELDSGGGGGGGGGS